jgi:uncharacterized protein
VKADPFAQLRLLDVQEIDSALDTVRHRLATIPEAATLRELVGRRTAIQDAARDLRIQVDDLTAAQKRADADVEQVKGRRTRDQQMVDSGSMTDAKALERMLGELQSLQRRIGDLEDVELEVMERLEATQSALDQRLAELATLDEQRAELEHAHDARAAELRAEEQDLLKRRGRTAEGLPGDLVTLYEKLRAQKGGVGAAALRARQCGGCRLALDPSILADIAKRPTDEVVRCEECSRILVRTGESGL